LDLYLICFKGLYTSHTGFVVFWKKSLFGFCDLIDWNFSVFLKPLIDRFRSQTSKTTSKWCVLPMYGYNMPFWRHRHVVFDVRVLDLNLSNHASIRRTRQRQPKLKLEQSSERATVIRIYLILVIGKLPVGLRTILRTKD
jgi:hypothetical protein